MNIKTYRFKIPFINPIFMLGNKLEHREGIVIELRMKNEELRIEEEDIRYIEISPFPGLHKETIDDIIPLKDKIIESVISRKVDESLPLSAQSSLNIFLKNLNPPSPNNILKAPLLHGSREEMEIKISKLEDQESVKLKLGRASIDKELDLFNYLDSKLDPKVKVRADINRNWTFDDALEFLNSIDLNRIEYLEEPINNPERLEELFLKTKVNYALDESIYEGLDIDSFPNARALVIKPSLLNNPIEFLEKYSPPDKWGEQMRFVSDKGRGFNEQRAKNKEQRAKIVFSSVFESDIGFNNLLSLLGSYGDLSFAHGLDTQDNFEYKLLSNGKLDLYKVIEI